MNKARRKELALIRADLEAIRGRIETLQEAEQEAFDNMPETLQDGDAGNQIQENADALSSAADDLQAVVDALEEMA